MTLKDKIREKNSWNHLSCPNCGKLYQMENRDGSIEMPQSCSRCRCPMDVERAMLWMDGKAVEDHDDAITAMGKKMRGELDVPGPSVDLESIKSDIRESLSAEIKASVAAAIAAAIPEIVSAVTTATAPETEDKPKGGK